MSQKSNTLLLDEWNTRAASQYRDAEGSPYKAMSLPKIRFTISVKVGGLAVLLMFGLVAIAAFSYYQMRQIGNDINVVANTDIGITNHNSNIQRLSFNRDRTISQFADLYEQNRHDKIEQARISANQVSQEIDSEFVALKTLISVESSADVIPRYSKLNDLLVEVRLLNSLVIEETDLYAEYLAADEVISAAKSNAKLAEQKVTIETLSNEVRRLTLESAANAQSRQARGTTAIIMVSLIALLLGSAISVILVRRLTNSIRVVAIRARNIQKTVDTDNFQHDEIISTSSDEVGDLATVFNEMSSSLERNIEERRRYEAELADARDEAMLANQAKSKFLATISHELRTPLNAIIGYSEMLEEEAEEKEQTELVPDLQRINSAGRHLLTLINEVLDLSKIEAGQMDVFVEDFDLANEIGEIVSLVGPLMAKNSNTFVQDIPEELGTMRADATKIRQALINLVGNAAKFTSDGTVTLSAERFVAEKEDWIRFDVSDTGIGMTPDQIDKVFQEFTQADSSISRRFEGSGLGLTLSRRFCQLMGGEISVTSSFGKGSTFTIELPINTEKYIPTEMLSSH